MTDKVEADLFKAYIDVERQLSDLQALYDATEEEKDKNYLMQTYIVPLEADLKKMRDMISGGFLNPH
jgi:hypothetical protein